MPPESGTDPVVDRFLRHAPLPGSVDALAAACGVPRAELERRVRAVTGVAPGRARRDERLRSARAALAHGDLAAAELAPRLGLGAAALGDLPREEIRGARAEATATLFLAATAPFDPDAVATFLDERVLDGLERVERNDMAVGPGSGASPANSSRERSGEGSGRARGFAWTRAWRTDAGAGTLTLRPGAEGALMTVRGRGRWPLAELITRAERVLDLRAPTDEIARVLGADALLRPSLARRPGQRVPGGWAPFEIAVRAVLGQQVSVAAARTHAERLVALCADGESIDGLRPFPSPAALAAADLGPMRLPGTRKAALGRLAEAVAVGAVDFAAPAEEVRAALLALDGIGPWTVDYVCLRGLKDPDAFLAGDLVVRQALVGDSDTGGKAGRDGLPSIAAVRERGERWRPFRAYATLHLWMTVLEARAAGRR